MEKGKNINHPAKGSSVKVEPIKNIDEINAIKNLLKSKPRDLALFLLGINSSLRVCELVNIRNQEAYSIISDNEFEIRRKNSKKTTTVSLDAESINAIERLVDNKQNNGNNSDPTCYLFSGKKGMLSLSAVNNLIKKWYAAIHLEGNYGCHTLRKTFVYHQLRNVGTIPSELSATFNHSNLLQTLEYIDLLPEILDIFQNNEIVPHNPFTSKPIDNGKYT